LLYEKGNSRELPAAYLGKIRRILVRLDEASAVQHMALPGFQLHPLSGDLKGFWAVSVTGN
jgi:proteic killer suppression protein